MMISQNFMVCLRTHLKTSPFVLGFFFLTLPIMAMAGDGSGSTGVTPGTVNTGATGTVFTFTYTATEQIKDGGVIFSVPSGWPAPQPDPSLPGYTTVTSTGTFGGVFDSLDSATGWIDDSLIVNVDSDTLVKKEGSASLKVSVLLSGLDTSTAWINYSTPQDWSSYTKAAFWILSGRALQSGDAAFLISESENIPADDTTQSFALPAANAATWSYAVIDLSPATPGTRDALLSLGFRFPIDQKGAFNIDNLSLGPTTSSIFSAGQVEFKLLELSTAGVITISYGGSAGVAIPDQAGIYTFPMQSRLNAGTYANLVCGSPEVQVVATTTPPPQSTAAFPCPPDGTEKIYAYNVPLNAPLTEASSTAPATSTPSESASETGTGSEPSSEGGATIEIGPGALIKLPDDGNPQTFYDTTVYYVAQDGKRYLFPNEKTYRTWFSDFLGVKEVTNEIMANLSLGGIVPYKPGVRLLKVPSDPVVYAVGARGVLVPLANEAVARTLLGEDWQQRLDDLPESFFPSYRVGATVYGGETYSPASYQESILDDQLVY